MGALLALYAFQPAQAQEKTNLDSLYDELELYFEDEGLPPGILDMADSLMALYDQQFHSIGVRAGYLSDVLTAGRDLGIDQHGFNTGLSYYHPSGFFGDIAGYSNSEYSPSFYLTNLSVGYWHTLGTQWTLSASHDFMFYHGQTETSYSFDKSIRGSIFHQRKGWELGVDYRYLYGKETAHRLVGVVNGRFAFDEVGFIDRISLIPGATVQWGNAEVLNYRQSETPLQDIYQLISQDDYPQLTNEEFLEFSYLLFKDRQLRATQYLRDKGYTRQQIESLLADYQSSRYVSDTSYGIMNIALNAGVSLSKKNWNLFINYTYNFPFALPGETYTYPRNDYVNASLMYTFLWSKK